MPQATNLRNGEKRVRAELSIVERVELVGGDHASAGKHRNAAVLELGLAELGHRGRAGVLREAERIEEAQRLACADHVELGLDALAGRLHDRSAEHAIVDEGERAGEEGERHGCEREKEIA